MSSPPASGVTDPQGASPLTAGELRHQSEVAASHLPPLLLEAQHLAGSVLLGEHGRRRAGMGDDFWQYRPVQLGDSRRMIDHRRSAKGDQQFVREREWQIAQTVHLWVDQGASMRYASDKALPRKVRGSSPSRAYRSEVRYR